MRKPNFTKAEKDYRAACNRRAKFPRDSEAFQKADEKAKAAYAKLSRAAAFYGIPVPS